MLATRKHRRRDNPVRLGHDVGLISSALNSNRRRNMRDGEAASQPGFLALRCATTHFLRTVPETLPGAGQAPGTSPAWCTSRLVMPVVDPVIADLQEEHASALRQGSRWRA
jgi:hypothetical protein